MSAGVGSMAMRRVGSGWLLLMGLLVACAWTGPRMGETPEPAGEVTSWEEGCEDARNLVLVCREGGEECGLFPCREVFAPEVVLAYRGGGGGIPLFGASPAPRRWGGRGGGGGGGWRHAGVRGPPRAGGRVGARASGLAGEQTARPHLSLQPPL